ncbi:HEAT repeat domain-containing protein [Paenibacillus thalictri]|uniref:HEAT repeat domain-containing protein n=1 Tax=Paenibacillus thalictri TaxID=2527873 RepID=A0A4Q9DK59_9BACL|nr:HEAT repeat domain-containing protein [Paenibacillus thalictri]TBL72442.1 HEAT repeat domain-containing protein [Paenibacillus thalictri]
MWMEPIEQADTVLIVLGVAIAGGFAALFAMRNRYAASADRMQTNLEQQRDYFAYLSANIDGPAPLLPPPGRLNPLQLKAVQSKLLEWIETIGGSHRDKLTALCRELGLVELELRRLRSFKHGERIEAAYHLGVMRPPECTGELLKLLEQEGGEPTAFVVARAAAKCADSLDDLYRLLRLLAQYHPDARRLIADIAASSSLDTAPLYARLLRIETDETLLLIALTGLSGRIEAEAFEALEPHLLSGHKEIRIKSAHLLLQYPHLLSSERIGELIRHPDWEIRAAAVKTAGWQQLESQLEALVQSLTDEQWWVRHYSAKSLSQLGFSGFEALCEAAAAGSSEHGTAGELALEAVHEELDRAAAEASRETRQIPRYNRLNFTFRRIVGEPGIRRHAN